MGKSKQVVAAVDHRRFREDFEAMACGQPDCTHATELVTLRPACHPDASLVVRYSFQLQAAAIACAYCGMGIVDIAVAARNGNHHNLKVGVLPAPTTVQNMTPAARKNRARKK